MSLIIRFELTKQRSGIRERSKFRSIDDHRICRTFNQRRHLKRRAFRLLQRTCGEHDDCLQNSKRWILMQDCIFGKHEPCDIFDCCQSTFRARAHTLRIFSVGNNSSRIPFDSPRARKICQITCAPSCTKSARSACLRIRLAKWIKKEQHAPASNGIRVNRAKERLAESLGMRDHQYIEFRRQFLGIRSNNFNIKERS